MDIRLTVNTTNRVPTNSTQTAPSDMVNSHIYFSLSYILHPSFLTVTVLLQLKMVY